MFLSTHYLKSYTTLLYPMIQSKIYETLNGHNSFLAGTKGKYFYDRSIFVSIKFSQIFTCMSFSTSLV